MATPKYVTRPPERPLVLSVRISQGEMAVLNAAVARTGIPVSTLVRWAVRDYLEKVEAA